MSQNLTAKPIGDVQIDRIECPYCEKSGCAKPGINLCSGCGQYFKVE